MIVPEHWAEARLQQRVGKRQITVRRFGWSDASPEAAQQHAELRAREAMVRIQAGENLIRREPKIAYNGAEGVPIREEIISRDGATVITRNGYGAKCLNSENVLFADVDFSMPTPWFWGAAMLVFVVAAAVWVFNRVDNSAASVLVLVIGAVLALSLVSPLQRGWLKLRGGAERLARDRIAAFSKAHPDWHLRLYRTPAGFRVLVMHKTFDPADVDVSRLFDALNVDPVYRRMCLHQRCFRARVSAKPWRIGISGHLRPRPGVWPVAEDRLAERQRWLAEYDAAAERFAACRFVEALGSKVVQPETMAVQCLHDELSRANAPLAIA